MDRTIPSLCLALVAGAASVTPTQPGEEQQIAGLIETACPGQRALAVRAGADFHSREGRAKALTAYRGLAGGCASAVGIVHARLSVLELDAGDFVAAEASARRALGLEATVANKLALLQVLARADRPEAAALYAELKGYDGDREDLWAGLSYIAFHLDDVPFMKVAAQRAIALGTKRWQAWFVGAVAEALEAKPDFERALKWLDRADELGAPARYTSDIRGSIEKAAARR